MGKFDSVYFKCSGCGEAVEVQSKSGNCELAEFDPDCVPAKIAADIMGSQAWCPRCDRLWTVVSINSPATVVMRLA